MNDSGAFPDVAIKMVEVGESTGALQEMLNSLADFYDEEIDTNLGRFITMVEPLLLVVMGIIIAGLLLSLYMPLFNMSVGSEQRRIGSTDNGQRKHRQRPNGADRPSSTSASRKRAPPSRRPRRRRPAASPSATGCRSSTCRSSASITSCSARFPPI